MTPFKERVIQIIRYIPQGKVVSYGQVAVYAGAPRAAREVGWILNGTEENVDLPWWRVINAQGFLSIRGTQHSDKYLQKKLLEADGVVVSEALFVDMSTYRYKATKEELRVWQLDEEYIERILQKY